MVRDATKTLKEAPGGNNAQRSSVSCIIFHLKRGIEEKGKKPIRGLCCGCDSDSIWALELSHLLGLSFAAPTKNNREKVAKTPINSP